MDNYNPFCSQSLFWTSLTFLTAIVNVSNIQVVSVTYFNGGDHLDMIPDAVVIGGTLRAFSNTSFYQLLQRIEEVLFFFFFFK